MGLYWYLNNLSWQLLELHSKFLTVNEHICKSVIAYPHLNTLDFIRCQDKKINRILNEKALFKAKILGKKQK